MTNDEMLERLGPDATLALVNIWYKDMPKEAILTGLNYMFPDDDNSLLASKIYMFVNNQ